MIYPEWYKRTSARSSILYLHLRDTPIVYVAVFLLPYSFCNCMFLNRRNLAESVPGESHNFTSALRVQIGSLNVITALRYEYSILTTKDRHAIKLILCQQAESPKPCDVGTMYRVFSLTWPAFMQISWSKRKRLHKKRVQLLQDSFGTPTWSPFHCFGTAIWPP